MDYDVKFNTDFHRWEVYSSESVVRAWELQPVFVAGTEVECEKYIIDSKRCEMEAMVCES